MFELFFTSGVSSFIMVSSVSGGKDGCEPFRVGKYKIGEVIGKGFFAE